MMIIKCLLTLVLVTAMLLTACSARAFDLTPSPTVIPDAETQPQAQVPLSPRTTQLASDISTNTIVATSEAAPAYASLSRRCAQIEVAHSDKPIRTGSLLFAEGPSILSLTAEFPKALNFLSDQIGPYVTISVSPLSGSLAWRIDTNTIRIRGPNGAISDVTLPANAVNGRIRQWLLNDRLIVESPGPDPADSPPREAIDAFFIISPDIATAQSYSITMAGSYANGIIVSHWTSSPVYSPQFDRAVYADESQTNPLDRGLVLWDATKQRILWQERRDGWDVEFSDLDWQRDGSKIVLAAPPPNQYSPEKYELVSLSTSGQATVLTNLAQLHHDEYLLMMPRWSPDGRYVAFLLNDRYMYTTGRLYVLDTQTNSITDFCTPVISSLAKGFAWSPKSDQIAFVGTEAASELFILDIATAKMRRIYSSSSWRLSLYGWVSW